MSFQYPRKDFIKKIPPQKQDNQPGIDNLMDPRPVYEHEDYTGGHRLNDKVALITGGDSGIGRAVAIAYAKEGADISIVYFDEHEDAKETKSIIEKIGKKCILIAGDISKEEFCNDTVEITKQNFGKIDILVNNAAMQFPQNSIEDITKDQLIKTFSINVFPMFYLVKAVLKYMKEDSCIINTSSITAYKGSKELIDYSATKGAIAAFTRSLALSLASRNIRVNGVAPGPIWTPLIPSSFDENKVGEFGTDVPLGRCGQPVEVAPAYTFLASSDGSYVTGQILHVNGGIIINS